MPDYYVGKSYIKIFDGYTVRKCKMRKALKRIKADASKDTTVWRRSFFSLKMEWIAHNFLYLIGYKRVRTRDVDLEYPCKRPEWQYIVCGLLTWIFVW